MQYLVTGLHRSGTSAFAKLFSCATGQSLLDDPEWAITHKRGALAYKENEEYRLQLSRHDVVKCPRMTECLTQVCQDFSQLQVLFLVRDPRDVYASIAEKVAAGIPTRMLDNHRFGPYRHPWQGVILAFNHYAQQAINLRKQIDTRRLTFVQYETFSQHKAPFIAAMCRLFDLNYDIQKVQDLLNTQLGPYRNKSPHSQTIKGAGRWKSELPSNIATEIEQVTRHGFRILHYYCCETAQALEAVSGHNFEQESYCFL